MQKQVARELFERQIITEPVYNSITKFEDNKHFSVRNQVKIFLSLGVMMLTGGLGIIIYKNIDSIGHLTIVIFIALICAACMIYCFYKGNDFTPSKAEAPNTGFDYILLLGSLTFLTLTGYLHFQFNIFGGGYGLATLVPALALFFLAYRFDHLGVLATGITLLASWFGITLTRQQFLENGLVFDSSLYYTGVGFCFLLLGISFLHYRMNIKKHFVFTYCNFAVNIGAIAALSGMFDNGALYFFIPVLAVILFIMYRLSAIEDSFYFILMAALYGYITLNYIVFKFIIIPVGRDLPVYLGLIWIIFSAIMLIRYLVQLKKQMKSHVAVQP
jgi:hypothetical protein